MMDINGVAIRISHVQFFQHFTAPATNSAPAQDYVVVGFQGGQRAAISPTDLIPSERVIQLLREATQYV